MIQVKYTFLRLIILSCLSANTPIEYTIGISGGYDNNVMRFSQNEFNDAAMNIDLLGGASTFDSFVYRMGISGKKSIWESRHKELQLSGSANWADYYHSPERKYLSGGFYATYRWGSYKNIKYSIRHLDSFYLRHYVNRDISTKSLEACAFTDRNQSISITNKLSRRVWANFGGGYLQRYYDKPFYEFDLNILYLKIKLNKRIRKIGIVSIQVDRGRAISQSHFLPNRPSSFNRSYETIEWYIPIKIQKKIYGLNEVGFSIRQESRSYDAEDPNDPLHAGRNHLDTKYDVWIEKNLTETLNVTVSGRYRTRRTESAYDWVTDLKSFKQLQFWCKIEWDLIYDRY